MKALPKKSVDPAVQAQLGGDSISGRVFPKMMSVSVGCKLKFINQEKIMKLAVRVIVTLMLMACGAMAEQRVGPFLTGMAGVGDNSGSAFGAGVKYEWLINETFGLDLRAGYLHDSDGDMGIVPLEFGPAVVIPLDALALTLGAGGCYAIPTGSDYDIDPALGFYAAVGIRGAISESMEWFAEAQYVKVEGDSDTRGDYWLNEYTYVVQESGFKLDLNAVGVNAGILWKF